MTSLDQIATPFLAVDIDILDANIARMRDAIVGNGIRWRPHIKSIKSPPIVERLQAAGADGVTCARVDEAEIMVRAGIRDILIANQIVDPSAIRRLVELNREAHVMAAVDSLANARMLSEAALAASIRLPVLIEVDVGLARAGVAPGDDAATLAASLAGLEGLDFRGVMAWEGHTTTIKDPAEKKQAVETAVSALVDSARRIEARGIPVSIVSCGGTGTYWLTAQCPGVIEIQAGGGIFCDLRYRTEFGVPHDYALTVWTTVTSRPNPQRIVVDAGWKTMSAYPRLPMPANMPHVAAVKLSAEHTTVELSQPFSLPAVGERLQFIVGYADSTVFLNDRFYAVRQNKVEAVWPIITDGARESSLV